jgi:hypothetical protein
MHNNHPPSRVGRNLRSSNATASPSSKRSLPWIITLSLGAAAAGCTAADAPGDHVEEEAQAITSSAALFKDTSTIFRPTVDWDVNHGKAECAPGEAIVGISEIPGGPGQTALCRASNASLSPGDVTATLLLSGSDQRLATRLGDWSPYFYKFECGPSQYVSAVSENASSHQGNNNFHGIQCAQGSGLGTNETCTPRVFDAGESRGTTSSGDWDPGAYKGECGADAYVVGVSVSVSTGAPHAILCCSSASPP